ncbi:hypothetical protein [Natronobacterium gregoryi]|nr:hypothetical protein [Natronobacterium gregoryi]PLK20357.1 hypothetical protein CYV19_10005 [Natronobacterium gregoryi SP2]
MASYSRTSRRTVLRGITAFVGGFGATGTATSRSTLPADEPIRMGDCPPDAQKYVATVDRIVDGQHVVMLLEEDGQVVDQLVVAADEVDVEEGDILVVVVHDDELLDYQVVPERPDDETIWRSTLHTV